MDAGGAVEAYQSKIFSGPPATSQDSTNINHPCAGQRCHPYRPGPSPGVVGATAGALNGWILLFERLHDHSRRPECA